MERINVQSNADAKDVISERNIQYIKLGVFDIDGVLRGKYVSREKFLSALDGGFGFCDVVLGWDSADQLYDNVNYTGWHSGYPDARVNVIPESCRTIPFEPESVLFLCEFADKAAEVCPRGVLKRVLEKAESMGYAAKAACEYEFFLFDETPQSLADKNYRNLKPITPGNFGYSVLRNSVHADFYQELLAMCETMNMPLEGLHTETGPGVLEAAIAVDDALVAADNAALFKTFTKVLAQHHDWMATFMAKWSPDYAGQSGHVHVSLWDKQGNSVFYDEKKDAQMSDTMRSFVAGQQRYMPEMLAMIAPTINSYTRLVPGFWAPTASSWGIENRTCALRVIPGSAKSQRVEYRVAGADANPYLAVAVAIASGLAGIEQQLTLAAPVVGNAYQQDYTAEEKLPNGLWDAAQAFKHSGVAKQFFGDAFVEHFAATREWEEREARKQITDWQLQRYFEII